MKSDKRQTMTLIGIALLAIAGVMLFLALSNPLIYEEDKNSLNTVTALQGENNKDTVQSVNSVLEDTVKNTETTKNKTAPREEKTVVIEPVFPININTATAEELMMVEGLGEVRANAIIEYREYIGKYTDVSEIKNIKGFGDSVYEQIAPYLTV